MSATREREDFSRFQAAIQEGREAELGEWLASLHPADIADLIEGLDEEERLKAFILLPPVLASDVLVEVNSHARAEIMEEMAKDRLAEIFDELDSNEAADLIVDLPQEEASLILSRIDLEDSEEVKQLLQYPRDSAGGIMQLELVAVDQEMPAREAVEFVRRASEKINNLPNIYVVLRDNTLVGSLPLAKLILTRGDTRMKDIMEPVRLSVTPEVDQEEVARMFKKYDLLSLPVVDEKGRLQGRIVSDDVMDVIEAEATEDIYRLGGVHQEEAVLDPSRKSIKIRLPWLVINLVTAFIAASVVGAFKDTIQAMVIIAAFLPVVAGMGGNAGTQTLTVVVRGLALGDLDYAKTKRVLLKEVRGGIANGAATGAIGGLVAYLWVGNVMLGLVLFMAMIANLFVASFFGTLIPLGLKRVGFDPAVSSSIFLTTFTDVAGFFTFLGLATLLIRFLV